MPIYVELLVIKLGNLCLTLDNHCRPLQSFCYGLFYIYDLQNILPALEYVIFVAMSFIGFRISKQHIPWTSIFALIGISHGTIVLHVIMLFLDSQYPRHRMHHGI